jgi:urease accessory protein UreH
VDRTRAALRPLERTPGTVLPAARLSRDFRALSEVGRRAKLELRFVERHGRTILADGYAEPPFRVGRPFDTPDGLHLIFACSAPGVFGGDCFDQSIVVEPGARVRLTSQSALQVHACPADAAAVISSTYTVRDGGRLECEWDAVIPFPRARLSQRTEIAIDAGSRLFWSDAWMAGRQARGEWWAFTELAHELRLIRAGSLDYLERYIIRPAARDVSQPWIAGDARYFGTTLAADVRATAAAAEWLHSRVAGVRGVSGAADALQDGLVLVRLMSESGVPFHAARAIAARWNEEREGAA